MPVSAAELHAWHLRPGAFERLAPAWEGTRAVARTGDVEHGGTVTLRGRVAGVPIKMVSRHSPAEALSFQDAMVKGPFKRWVHTHTAIPEGKHSVLVDHVEYELPMGAPGQALAGRSTRRRLERLFAWRHQRMTNDLSHRIKPQKVAITGASGLLGNHLQNVLQTQGHTVEPVPRLQKVPLDHEGPVWDPAVGIPEPRPWNGFDAVVHLAGETISQRWTASTQKRIWDSRVPATRRLCEALAALDQPPKTLLSASAVGYYGDHPEPVDESGPRGGGFLAELVEAWEAAADPARDAGIRVVHPRTGIVLSKDGGAFPPLLRVAKLGAGGPIAGGKQWWPWIHIDDEIYAMLHLLDKDIQGPVNMVSPGIVTQKEFAKVLGHVVHRPSIAPLPHAAVGVMFGQMGHELFELGQHLKPGVLERTGYQFAHPNLEEALRFELGLPAEVMTH